MTSYAAALKFFEACESNEGWEGCKQYVVDESAPFKVQAAALKEITTIQAYAEWVKAFGTITAPGEYMHYLLSNALVLPFLTSSLL
jgi:hypothetical protein